MSDKETKSSVEAGEAGYKGRDRQPSRKTPPESVQTQSQDSLNKPAHNRGDMVHPGPDREDGEKSKGNAHHDQREKEPDMQEKFEDL